MKMICNENEFNLFFLFSLFLNARMRVIFIDLLMTVWYRHEALDLSILFMANRHSRVCVEMMPIQLNNASKTTAYGVQW